MGDIVRSVTRAHAILAEISGASQKRSTGIEQVSRAIGEMDPVTRQNAAPAFSHGLACGPATVDSLARMPYAEDVHSMHIAEIYFRPMAHLSRINRNRQAARARICPACVKHGWQHDSMAFPVHRALSAFRLHRTLTRQQLQETGCDAPRTEMYVAHAPAWAE